MQFWIMQMLLLVYAIIVINLQIKYAVDAKMQDIVHKTVKKKTLEISQKIVQ